MEQIIKKNMVSDLGFLVNPTRLELIYIEDAWSDPDADKDTDAPDLILVNAKMTEDVNGGSSVLHTTKLYPYEFKTAFKFNSTKFELEVDDDILNALFIKYNIPIQII